MSSLASEFSQRLKAAREMRGLSQSDLAQRSGLQASAVSHFESGRRSPSLENLIRLADALAISIDFLLGRTSGQDRTSSSYSGRTADRILGQTSDMRQDDLDLLSEFAKLLATRRKS